MTKQKQATPVAKTTAKKTTDPKTQDKSVAKDDDLVVFAFRLTPAERELIHKAAGPAKASRFVRALAVAAAGGDEAAVLALLGGPAPAIN